MKEIYDIIVLKSYFISGLTLRSNGDEFAII